MKQWIKAAGIRALKTVAQTAGGYLTGATLFSEVNWLTLLSASIIAGVYSLLMSVAGLPELKGDTNNG